jgi:hypothetical protein
MGSACCAPMVQSANTRTGPLLLLSTVGECVHGLEVPHGL